MNERKAPLFEKLAAHRLRNTASFHVPGHKSGKGLLTAAAPYFGQVMAIDLTEITGLDDLHDPEGVIREAQQLAAACFGAEETFFLVGGSTVGNLSLILALCEPGDVLIVQRNAHKSVIHGLMLARASAVFVPPRWDPDSGLATGVSAADVEEALRRHPEAKGVLITNPNYYGMGIDTAAVARIAHAYGKPLIVDEAHGAHYGFHPDLPASALSCGADAVVQSTHKMLTAMTMGAMLHVQGNRIDRDTVRQRLSMLQSSSPSYPIMASLDVSRLLVRTEGAERLERGLRAVARIRQKMREWPWYRMIDEAPRPAYETKDPFKVAIRDATGTLSGFELREALERRGLMTEMADPRHVLLVFSLANDERDADRLAEALDEIREEAGLERKLRESGTGEAEPAPYGMPLFAGVSPPVRFEPPKPNPGRAGTAAGVAACSGGSGQVRTVSLEHAVGMRSAEMIVPYPPGIPVLYPGEAVTRETADYLRRLSRAGARFQGAADPTLRTLRIFSSNRN